MKELRTELKVKQTGHVGKTGKSALLGRKYVCEAGLRLMVQGMWHEFKSASVSLFIRSSGCLAKCYPHIAGQRSVSKPSKVCVAVDSTDALTQQSAAAHLCCAPASKGMQ